MNELARSWELLWGRPVEYSALGITLVVFLFAVIGGVAGYSVGVVRGMAMAKKEAERLAMRKCDVCSSKEAKVCYRCR